MSRSNSDVAQVFDEIADLLEILDDNAFRVRAYRNAAQLIYGLGTSVAEMLSKGEDLTELPGIGKELAAKIRDIIDTGTCAAREDLRKKLPGTITTLLKIPGLGPKRVQMLYRRLDISSPEQLAAALAEGKVRELPGFGEKTEAALREVFARTEVAANTRVLLATAAAQAEPLRAHLAATPGVEAAVIAGSYRRARETVGDIDIVVTAKNSDAAMERFCEYRDVREIKSKGDTRATVILSSGLQVDLRVVPQESFGAALYYFTGSKAHNVAVRRIAQKKKLKINEYGVFRGKRRIAGETEPSVFKTVGLPYIPPELRENRGEIEAAQAGKLPQLIEAADLQGDLHVDATNLSDAQLRDWTKAAREHGMSYLGLALRTSEKEHALRLADSIDKLGETLRGFTLFKAIEFDIDENGALNPKNIDLARFDFVIGAVSDAFDLSRAKQTRRLLQALENPALTLLAHPTNRLINKRPPLDLDLPKIIRTARDCNCWLELNAQPERLDLPDVYCRLAKDEGVLIAINSGDSTTADFAHLSYGIGQAKRGWLEAKNVVNTRSAKEVRALLRARS